jgi:AcrR family transcriptional regulator
VRVERADEREAEATRGAGDEDRSHPRAPCAEGFGRRRLEIVKNPSGSPFASVDARLERRIRRRKRPIQARAAGTVEALVEATLQVLVRDGYARLTTTRVAERAGVSVGTLYQYFPDKRALVTALKVRYFGLMTSAVEVALRERAALDPRGEDVEGTIRAALGALLEVKRTNRSLTRALREPMAEMDGHGFVHETLARFVTLFTPLLVRLEPRADASRRGMVLVSALEGAITYAALESPVWLEQEWVLEELVRLALGGLGVTARRARGSPRTTRRAVA